MRPVILFATVVAASALLAENAKADDADTTADLRCFIAATASGTMVKDPSQKMALQMAAIYYLGRMDGRTPKLNLEKEFVDEYAKLTRQDIGLEDIRCGKFMTERGAVIVQIGKNLEQRGK